MEKGQWRRDRGECIAAKERKEHRENDRGEENGKRSYRYRMEFEKTVILQHFMFNAENKLIASDTEDIRKGP